MCFAIELESYQNLEAKDPEDCTVSEAIESAYRAGPAVHIHIAPQTWVRLPVSGGVSDIYNDLIRMLKALELSVYPFEISFLCSGFTAIWKFSESKGVLTIRTAWTSVDGNSNDRKIKDEQFNDTVTMLRVEKQKFVAEWHKLLARLKLDLLSVGYGNYLDNFEYLEQLA